VPAVRTVDKAAGGMHPDLGGGVLAGEAVGQGGNRIPQFEGGRSARTPDRHTTDKRPPGRATVTAAS
jgi:hypothetical protein